MKRNLYCPVCSLVLPRRSFLPAVFRSITFLLLLLLAVGGMMPTARAAETGILTGVISNTATGNLLEGARVEIPQLGLSTLTDLTGRYVFADVSPGTYEVIASYTGLDPVRAQINVPATGRTVRDFDLTTGIYQLDAFKVTGEREGGAAAITAQRNADN